MRKMALKGSIAITMSLGLLWLGVPQYVFAHGKELVKKAGGPPLVEIGPHGGAAINIGDGHFELVRDPAGVLSLYRLDDDLKAIPAEDVDGARLYAVMPGAEMVMSVMERVRSNPEPLHYSVKPNIRRRGSYLAIIGVSMGDESQNLRFQVRGN